MLQYDYDRSTKTSSDDVDDKNDYVDDKNVIIHLAYVVFVFPSPLKIFFFEA
jgi:hypothetical protein